MAITDKNKLQNFWQGYHLNADPFAENQAEHYFPVAEWEKHLDLIHHLLHYSNVIISVIGDTGSGKSTLRQQLLLQFDDSLVLAHTILSAKKVTIDNIADVLRQAFDLQSIQGNSTHEILENQLDEIQHYEQICVLIIEDAHKLEQEVLTVLLELISQQSETQMRLHIVLFGQTLLQEKLHKIDQQLQEFSYNIALEALTQQQTRQYLAHRFHAAGLMGNFPLKDTQVTRLWKMSQGNPKEINEYTKQLMLSQVQQPKAQNPKPQKPSKATKPSKAKPVKATKKSNSMLSLWQTRKKTIIIGVVLVLAFIAVSWLSERNQSSPTTVEEKVTPVTIVEDAAKPALPVVEEEAIIITIPDTLAAPVVLNHVKLSKLLHQASPPTTVNITEAIAIETIDDEEVPMDDIDDADDANDVDENIDNEDTVTTTAESTKTVTKPKTVVKQSGGFFKHPTKAVKAKKSDKTIKTKNKEKTPAKTSTASNKYSKDESFLLAQDSGLYTLQVMASVDRKLLVKESRIILNKRKYPSYLFRYGSKWYVLVYGVYPTFNEAKAAIKTIPKSLRRRIKPWPRKLHLIQGEIRRPRGKKAKKK